MTNSRSRPRPRAEILPTHTPELFATAVRRAAALLRAGEVVALPTETVYGLAANAWNPEAVARIYVVKGRPAHNPLIVHVAGGALARDCVADWPEEATCLATAFWPGPLTLVLPRSKAIPDIVTAGGRTVGIRWPSHPFIQAVVRECGFPLAAPSANLANAISPTNAHHVDRAMGNVIPLIVDGGQCQVGIESTVIDLTLRPARLLRPGLIHEESLGALIELAAAASTPAGGTTALASPGQLPVHYAPRARLVILRWTDERDLLRHLRARVPEADQGSVHVLAHQVIPSAQAASRVCVIPHDPEAYARAMYAEWHRCDELGARWIVVEAVPDGPAWQGIRDRLERAGSVLKTAHPGTETDPRPLRELS